MLICMEWLNAMRMNPSSKQRKRVAKLISNIIHKTYQGLEVLIFGSLAALLISFHQYLVVG